MNAAELFALVRDYHALGDHRTGTAVDSQTLEWFSSELSRHTSDVSLSNYEFPFYNARCEVRIDSVPVISIARYYSGCGAIRTSSPVTSSVYATGDGDELRTTFSNLSIQAEREGARAAVLATRCATDSLCAINERPRLDGNLPSVLVAGKHARELAEHRVDLDFDARIEIRQSSNIVARLGSRVGAPVVVTTPLSGWFGCAGERGTGIAILLDLIEPLAEIAPLIIVGASGHELDYFGAWQHATKFDTTPRAVLHLGSSIATSARIPSAGHVSLSPDIQITTNLTGERVNDVRDVAAELGTSLVVPVSAREPHQWVGESSCWARFGCSMLSVAGYHPLFHTPEDTPERATTPALLESVRDAVLKMAQTLIMDK